MGITVGTATLSGSTGTTSATVTIHSSVATDDILVLDIVNRDSTSAVTVADTDAGGNTWALLTNQAADTNGSGQRWWKRATSGTASKVITISLATGSVCAVCTPYRGCPTTGTPFGTAVSEANASGNEVQAGITTTRNSSWVLFMVACTSNDTLNPTSYTATDPSTLTEQGEAVSTGGSDCSVSHASAEKAVIGATGNISWAQTNGTGASIATELFNVISLGDDSDGFVADAYLPAVLASILAATVATSSLTSRAVAIEGGDREDIPAGFVQPNLDDGYRWVPIVQPEYRATSPFFEQAEQVPQPVAFLPDEDYQLPVIQWPLEPNGKAPPPYTDDLFWPLDAGDAYQPTPIWPAEWLCRQAPEQGDAWLYTPHDEPDTRRTPVWGDGWNLVPLPPDSDAFPIPLQPFDEPYTQAQPRWPDVWFVVAPPEAQDQWVPPPVADLDDSVCIPQPRWPDEWSYRAGHDESADWVQPPLLHIDELYRIIPVACANPPNRVVYPPDRGELASEDPGIWLPDDPEVVPTWTAETPSSSPDWTPESS